MDGLFLKNTYFNDPWFNVKCGVDFKAITKKKTFFLQTILKLVYNITLFQCQECYKICEGK